jgi:hypothetical protein
MPNGLIGLPWDSFTVLSLRFQCSLNSYLWLNVNIGEDQSILPWSYWKVWTCCPLVPLIPGCLSNQW